jgi:hypothetical protein
VAGALMHPLHTSRTLPTPSPQNVTFYLLHSFVAVGYMRPAVLAPRVLLHGYNTCFSRERAMIRVCLLCVRYVCGNQPLYCQGVGLCHMGVLCCAVKFAITVVWHATHSHCGESCCIPATAACLWLLHVQ